MKIKIFAAALALALTSAASADPWKDESGHSRRGYERSHRDYGRDGYREQTRYDYYGNPQRSSYRQEGKQKYFDGRCKVERKIKKGEWEEKRKCRY